MSDIASLTLQALYELNPGSLPHYDEGLRAACSSVTPLFGEKQYGDIYRAVAINPQWMAISLMTNAKCEGDGANRLWNLAASTPNADVSEQVRQHAIDESCHARAYIAILDLCFPNAVDESLHAELLTLSPGYSPQGKPEASPGSPYAHALTVDDLIQMNIAEIRTRIHHLLQRPILVAFCPPESQVRLLRILDSLLVDETRHIAYTAVLIERSAASGDAAAVKALILERLRDFNEVTRQEIERRIFE